MQGFCKTPILRHNILTLPPQVTNLVLSQSPGTITGSFNGVAAQYTQPISYLVVYKAGGIPNLPTDGNSISITANGSPIYSFNIPGLTNGTSYGVRIFVLGNFGFQTSQEAQGTITPVAGIAANTLPVGSKIKFAVGGVDYNWLIVNIGNPDAGMYDASCNGVWLLIEDIYNTNCWSSDGISDYENSTINAYLNGNFYNLIESGVQSQIIQAKIPYREGKSGSTISYGSNGLLTKIFLLCAYEIGFTTDLSDHLVIDGFKLSYFESGNVSSANNKRISYFNNNAFPWLLRSPDYTNAGNVFYVTNLGRVGVVGANTTNYGIRPALILPLNFMLETTPNSDGSYNPI